MARIEDKTKLTPADVRRMGEKAVQAAIDIALATDPFDPFAARNPQLRGKPVLDGVEGTRQIIKKAEELGLVAGE